MNTNTRTFEKLLAYTTANPPLSGGRAATPRAKLRRAHALATFLEAVAGVDKSSLLGAMSEATFNRRVQTLAAAGIAPINATTDLRQIVADLGLSLDSVAATRLCWSLNADRSRTLAAATRRWEKLVWQPSSDEGRYDRAA